MAVVTDEVKVGGGCINWATIPSKAQRHSVKQVIDRNTNPMFREFGDARKLSFQQILKNAESLSWQVFMRFDFYDRIQIFSHSWAR